MVPLHTFKVDLIGTSGVSEREFRELTAYSLSCLEALARAFGRKQSFSVSYYPPNSAAWNPKGWSSRCVLLLSVGKNRVDPLLALFDIVINQIETDLPPYIDVVPDVVRFDLEK